MSNTSNQLSTESNAFIQWFRNASPYINAHRGKVFVIMLPGECIEHGNFHLLVNDIALLNSLGIRLVLVHGANQQINAQLQQAGLTASFHQGLRVTEPAHLPHVCQAVGALKIKLEAALSAGLPNSPMQGAHIKTVSGNFVTAMPRGVIEGIDFHHTGKVRRVDTAAVNRGLDQGAVVLVSNLGFSLTGEVFNLTYSEVATHLATTLRADKLIALSNSRGVFDEGGQLLREFTLNHCQQQLDRFPEPLTLSQQSLAACYQACRQGVPRAHLISYEEDGALLEELFTRDGSGTMIYNNSYESLRDATIDDVGGILELLEPLEKQGLLVRRSRELLETEIGRFKVIEKDGTLIACAALYPFDGGAGEIAAVATREAYRRQGRGALLLKHLEQAAVEQHIHTLFILTTQTAHWFIEQGFREGRPEDLPKDRQQLYNYQRKSKVFVKKLSSKTR